LGPYRQTSNQRDSGKLKRDENHIERPRSVALEALIAALKTRAYRFVAPTPATHARILARDPARHARSLEDMLGWSLPFEPGTIDAEIEALLDAAGALAVRGQVLRSRLRASTLRGDLYLHSAYPTTERDAVFFGPDSYRFARLIESELRRSVCAGDATIVDLGTGAGVGGILSGHLVPAARIILTDINPMALTLARANAGAANIRVTTREGPMLASFDGPIDLAVANPPYLVDSEGRTYRDGGDRHGAALSIEMASAILPNLAALGRLILYTGSAIVDGQDHLAPDLARLARDHGCALDYEEIDPDVFGEELERPAYRDVERIAVVSAIFRRHP
jgi:methylase of polypeptide subunit release factors